MKNRTGKNITIKSNIKPQMEIEKEKSICQNKQGKKINWSVSHCGV